TNGEFLQTFVSQYGCDSIVNLALIVHPLYNLNERLSVCENDLPYTWRDTTFEIGTAGGTFIFRRNSEFGCDSVVTLTLNVNPIYTQSENVVICENDLPYTWRDTIFEVGTTDGLFTFNKTSISGCDSVVHLNLTVNPSYNINDALVICSQELPYTWEGHLFPVGTNSDDYVFYHTSIDGCDSIVTLSLTVNPSYEQSEEIDICANDFPFTWRDTTFEEGTQSGNFTFVRQTIAGCDSIVHLSLTINALPVFNILGNTTINLGQSTMLVATFGVGNSYIWSNGDQGNVINVSPTENTTYQVTVTNAAGCSASDSVLVTVIDTIGICDNKLETNIMLYPNPATVNVTIKTDREVMNSVEIYNMLGALVRRVGVQQNEAVIEISDLQKGSYVLRILMQNGDIARKKLIIE
ncbi:MAG: T9SS type A sorting domain-containing protein, partial [Bacteroidales bacterium]|nr:T9SS type A sorting domain-containing protein [Bacteroidales bacterium]